MNKQHWVHKTEEIETSIPAFLPARWSKHEIGGPNHVGKMMQSGILTYHLIFVFGFQRAPRRKNVTASSRQMQATVVIAWDLWCAEHFWIVVSLVELYTFDFRWTGVYNYFLLSKLRLRCGRQAGFMRGVTSSVCIVQGWIVLLLFGTSTCEWHFLAVWNDGWEAHQEWYGLKSSDVWIAGRKIAHAICKKSSW